MERVYCQRKRQISVEISKEKVKKKVSGEAYDINKQTIYIVLKSRAHHSPQPAHGAPPLMN